METYEGLREVETKILDTTEASMLTKIQTLGFVPYFSGQLKAQWLMNPANGEKLRIRQEGEIVMVEYKFSPQKTDDGAKSIRELGFKARDFDKVISVLMRVGFEKQGLLSIKQRNSYVLNYDDLENRVRLDFDTYENLGWEPIPELLEVETTSEERLWEMIDALWLNRSLCMDYGPPQLFRHYYPNKSFA